MGAGRGSRVCGLENESARSLSVSCLLAAPFTAWVTSGEQLSGADCVARWDLGVRLLPGAWTLWGQAAHRRLTCGTMGTGFWGPAVGWGNCCLGWSSFQSQDRGPVRMLEGLCPEGFMEDAPSVTVPNEGRVIGSADHSPSASALATWPGFLNEQRSGG